MLLEWSNQVRWDVHGKYVHKWDHKFIKNFLVYWDDLGRDERTVLKYIYKNILSEYWAGFIYPKAETSSKLLS